MKRYGMIIGTEFAGRTVEANGNTLTLRTKFPTADISHITEEKLSATKLTDDNRITFKHHQMHFYDDDTRTETIYGFWVSEVEKDPKLYIMDELISAYPKGK